MHQISILDIQWPPFLILSNISCLWIYDMLWRVDPHTFCISLKLTLSGYVGYDTPPLLRPYVLNFIENSGPFPTVVYGLSGNLCQLCIVLNLFYVGLKIHVYLMDHFDHQGSSFEIDRYKWPGRSEGYALGPCQFKGLCICIFPFLSPTASSKHGLHGRMPSIVSLGVMIKIFCPLMQTCLWKKGRAVMLMLNCSPFILLRRTGFEQCCRGIFK